MDFKDTRLYELLRWMGAVGVGASLFVGCVLLLQEKILPLQVNVHEPALYFLVFFCLLLIVSSAFVNNETVRFFLGAIGTVFLLGIICLQLYASSQPRYYLDPIIALWLIGGALRDLSSKKQKNYSVQYCLFAQIFSAFGLTYALLVLGPSYFPSAFERFVGSHVLLPSMPQVLLSGFDVLYIALGVFLSTSLLISFALSGPVPIIIFPGALILSWGLVLLLVARIQGVATLLSYGLFVTVLLAFMCYRLYHQRRE